MARVPVLGQEECVSRRSLILIVFALAFWRAPALASSPTSVAKPVSVDETLRQTSQPLGTPTPDVAIADFVSPASAPAPLSTPSVLPVATSSAPSDPRSVTPTTPVARQLA